MSPTREAQFLAQLASDDHNLASAAFTALFNVHRPKLLRSAINYGRIHDVSRAICEEIVHDAFVQLWCGRTTPPAAPLGSFLATIVKRRILNTRRDAQSEDRFLPEHYARCGYTPAYDHEGNLLWSGPFADARTLRLEVFESFARTVNAMTSQRRIVTTDSYCDDYTVAESAELRAIAITTVKKLRQRGRRILTQTLQAEGHTLD